MEGMYLIYARLEITSSLGARRINMEEIIAAECLSVSKLLPRWVRGGFEDIENMEPVILHKSRNYFLAGCEEDG